MQSEKLLNSLTKEVLDKLYGFAYVRCKDSYEAEELCSDIVMAILKTITRGVQIKEFDNYIFGIAYRVYADFCKKRRIQQSFVAYIPEYDDSMFKGQEDLFLTLENDECDRVMLDGIYREIAFLSRIYRETMVMYYLNNESIQEISKKLGIKETTVKQRLFSARNILRREVSIMKERKMTLQPIHIKFVGSGDPIGNDPSVTADRLLSQNLIYLCKDKPRSAKELSEELYIPMAFVEDELEIQKKGVNGEYGLLKKLDNGKYTTNFVLLNKEEYERLFETYNKYLTEFYTIIDCYIQRNEERIKNFPYLNVKKEVISISWQLILLMAWSLNNRVNEKIQLLVENENKHIQRDYSIGGFACKEGFDANFYGNDGIEAHNICGYSKVQISNLYGKKVKSHFRCGHNVSQDPLLMLTIQSIKGLDISKLSERDKEIAAKAIECGYMIKDNKILKPNIIVIHEKDRDNFNNLASDIAKNCNELADQIAKEMVDYIHEILPKHLMGEYTMLNIMGNIPLFGNVVDKCIEKGLLTDCGDKLFGESVLMVIS